MHTLTGSVRFSRMKSIIQTLCLFLVLPWMMTQPQIHAHADPLSEGRALYKAGNYSAAVSMLEQAVKQKPNDAEIWWQLNFAYNKLGDYSNALKAVQTAGKLDPSYSFASSPAKYNETLARLEAKTRTGGGESSTTSSMNSRINTMGTGSGNIAQQLLNGDVYVQPGMNVDAAKLQQVSNELRPVVVKFVVFNSKSRASTLYHEAERIRKYLDKAAGIGDGFVIVSSRMGVSASGKTLDPARLRSVTQTVAPIMEEGDYTKGLEMLAKGLVRKEKEQQTATSHSWLAVGVIALAIVLIFYLLGRASTRSKIKARQTSLEREKSQVVMQLNMLDESIRSLTDVDTSLARQSRVMAGSKLDEASRIMLHLKTDQDCNRAQSLLDQASADINQGRVIIAKLTGQPVPNANMGGAPPVQTASAVSDATTNWQEIPDQQKGVCFFCSKPCLLNELTPVTVNLNGSPQKVLACQNDLQTIQSGQTPQIRAFNVNGSYVPWYAYNGYDPYQNYYSQASNQSFLTDMIALSMIDNMYWNWRQPMGWGWGGFGGGGYCFYPDHGFYQDYSYGNAAGFSDWGSQNIGGTDFLQGSSGDIGGGDLGSNFGGSDFGGGDQS